MVRARDYADYSNTGYFRPLTDYCGPVSDHLSKTGPLDRQPLKMFGPFECWTCLWFTLDLNTGLISYFYDQSCLIAKWSFIGMPFEYRTSIQMVVWILSHHLDIVQVKVSYSVVHWLAKNKLRNWLYIDHLKTKLAWYSNGKIASSCFKILICNGILILGAKMSEIKWHLNSLLDGKKQ